MAINPVGYIAAQCFTLRSNSRTCGSHGSSKYSRQHFQQREAFINDIKCLSEFRPQIRSKVINLHRNTNLAWKPGISSILPSIPSALPAARDYGLVGSLVSAARKPSVGCSSYARYICFMRCRAVRPSLVESGEWISQINKESILVQDLALRYDFTSILELNHKKVLGVFPEWK